MVSTAQYCCPQYYVTLVTILTILTMLTILTIVFRAVGLCQSVLPEGGSLYGWDVFNTVLVAGSAVTYSAGGGSGSCGITIIIARS